MELLDEDAEEEDGDDGDTDVVVLDFCWKNAAPDGAESWVLLLIVEVVLVDDGAAEELGVSQRPAGAPSAHFNSLLATPLQTSSIDNDLPSSTKAYAVGPETQEVSVCVLLCIS